MWTGNCYEIDIQFIRHGLTPLNEKRCYISYTDEGLSEQGIADINNKVLHKYYDKTQMIFISSRKRVLETAKIIFPDCDYIENEKLDEISFGAFEGKSYEELKDNEAYKKWLDSGGVSKIPSGESRGEFIKRQVNALNQILCMAKDKSQVSVVAHGGTVMALFSQFTNLDYYDFMIKSGEKICCHICYEIKGNNSVSISHFSITYRDNP